MVSEPLDAATRPSRLPLLAHIAVVQLLSLSFLTGLVVWRGQVLQGRTLETPVWLHAAVVLHGSLNPFLCGLFGYLCCQHIRIGWHLRAVLASGFSMELVFAGLILSGVGLYYAGSDEWRNTLIRAHRILGLLLPLSLSVHWAAGRRWAKKISN